MDRSFRIEVEGALLAEQRQGRPPDIDPKRSSPAKTANVRLQFDSRQTFLRVRSRSCPPANRRI